MTQLIISVAKFPGKEGERFHNYYYNVHNLDLRYVALPASNIKDVLVGIRKLGILGCSISHPFKLEAVQYVDKLEKMAKQVGAINTVVNDNGVLTGYNTDIAGAEAALKDMLVEKTWNVAILGYGGAARAVVRALQTLGVVNYTIYARKFGNWEERIEHEGDLLINATPIGMVNKQETPFPLRRIVQFKNYLDVIPNVTILQAQAAGLGLRNRCGSLMKTVQAEKQFELYTGIKLCGSRFV